MRFSIRYADKVVGTLVIIAIAVLIFVIFMLGTTQRWFAKDIQYLTEFNSGAGLSVNMSITYRGFPIGQVRRIVLTPEDKVEVTFTIFEEEAHRVRDGSVVELNASPIGLGNSFLFHPGRGEELLPEGSIIPEINSAEARMLIAMGLTERLEGSDSINNIINHVNSLLEIINISLSGRGGAEDLTLGQIFLDLERTMAGVADLAEGLPRQLDPILTDVEILMNDLQNQISPILSNIETVTDQLASPSGTIMSILDAEGPVFTSIAEALDSVAGIIDSVDKTMEFIPAAMPQITILLSDVQSALREAEKLIIALLNNPLLRGGVPQVIETGPGAASPRNLEF